jgi:polar amino acid transport system substrate-binding protein
MRIPDQAAQCCARAPDFRSDRLFQLIGISSMTISSSLRILTTLLTLAGLTMQATAHAETTLERIKRTGVVRIGYANEAPFAFTKLDGKVSGESPEIARIIFRKMGIKKVKSVLTEWGALIPGLKANRFDVIAAGMYITPKRAKQVLFTDPHYQLKDTLLVQKGNPKKLHSYADIVKDPALKLAIMAGTAEYQYAIDEGVRKDQILQVPNTIAQFQAVKTKRADAAVGTKLTMKDLARKSRNKLIAIVVFIDDPSHIGYGALAFRKDDQDLRDAVNTTLHAWLGSEQHLATVKPFGFDRSNLTDKTAAELAGEPAAESTVEPAVGPTIEPAAEPAVELIDD